MTSKCSLKSRQECSWLERNFLTCIKEKALKDNVETMECKVENVKESLIEGVVVHDRVPCEIFQVRERELLANALHPREAPRGIILNCKYNF